MDEGLPSSEVYDVYQDKLGYIWFATDKGLSRYNGYEFENFTTKDGLPGNTILNFYPQIDGRVFCYEYHSQSLFYFHEEFKGFVNYSYNEALKKHLKKSVVVKNLIMDTNQTLTISGYHLEGYIEIDKDGVAKTYFNKDTYETSKDSRDGVNLGLLRKNNFFFYVEHNYPSSKDVMFINIKKSVTGRMDFVTLNDNKTVFIDSQLGILSKDGTVVYDETEQYPIGIKKINSESFFVGYYSKGAEIKNVSGDVIYSFLPNKSVSNFLIDTEESIWFTTLDDGVFYIKNPNIKTFTEQHISSIVKDNYEQLFLGFENGNIGQIKNDSIYISYHGLSRNASIVEFDKTNNLIFGYGDGYLKDYTNNYLSYNLGVNKLPENIHDSLLGSSGTGYHKLENDIVKFRKINNRVNDVCLYNNQLLIGTSSGLFVEKNDSILKFQPNAMLASRIDDIDISNNKKTVFMATQGEGVIVFNNSIYSVNTKDGLTSNIVNEVHIENDSIVWACTNTGLNRIVFNPNKTFSITTITKADGLLSNDIEDVEIINDTIWVATKKGLCFFNKDVLRQQETSNVQSLTLKEISVNNKRIFDNNIRLKHDENNIDFKLQAISHKNTDNIVYSYRLKEIDTAWSRTTNRVINFPSLSSGNYTFEAKASIFDNPNELITSYSFKILPPFWKSWWFFGLCFFLLTGLVYVFFRVRVLTYNQDVFRELIRLAIKRLKRKEQFYKFRSNGEDFKIPTHDILYINSQGNYLDIITKKKTYTIRCKIGDFIDSAPDALEYLRVHRSYIIRIDQVTSKGKNWVTIKDQKIPVGETYLKELDKIHF